MLAFQLVKQSGLKVLATTRNPNKRELLLSNGTDHVIDNGHTEPKVRALFPAH